MENPFYYSSLSTVLVTPIWAFLVATAESQTRRHVRLTRLPSRQLDEVIGRHLSEEAACLVTFAWFNGLTIKNQVSTHFNQPGCWAA